MDSKNRTQLELLPKAGPHTEEVNPTFVRMIRKRPTLLSAWNMAQQVAGLEDKAIYSQLGIDASHYTKITNGTGNLPADERFTNFLDVVQNEIPLIWLAEKRGYDWLTIRQHRNDEQRRIAELEQENNDLKRAFQLAFGAKK